MLSQYTWWDFIKVVGTGLVLYYAYVAWAYYREDIRDWISNRGQPQNAPVAQVDEPEDDTDDSNLYSVSDYAGAETSAATQPVAGNDDPVDNQPEKVAPEPLPAPVEAQADPEDSQAIVVEGVIPDSDEEPAFEIALQIEPIKPAERSLIAVVRAAQGLQVDEQGRLLADAQAGDDTKELADTINEQKGFGSVLSGVNFNR